MNWIAALFVVSTSLFASGFCVSVILILSHNFSLKREQNLIKLSVAISSNDREVAALLSLV
jgi:hypothetical protein